MARGNIGGRRPAFGTAARKAQDRAAYVSTLPANTVPPVVSGTGTVGSTLTSTTGTWTQSPTSYTYQWRRDGSAIIGANASTYVLAAADSGHSVVCQVAGVNAFGTGNRAASNAIAVA